METKRSRRQAEARRRLAASAEAAIVESLNNRNRAPAVVPSADVGDQQTSPSASGGKNKGLLSRDKRAAAKRGSQDGSVALDSPPTRRSGKWKGRGGRGATTDEETDEYSYGNNGVGRGRGKGRDYLTTDDEATEDDEYADGTLGEQTEGTGTVNSVFNRVRRYRGFSTSISSLFLDETLVCPAISCFGLLLGQRTEYLLNERNRARGMARRGRKAGDRRPSHLLAVALVLTVASVALSYAVCGFGQGVGVFYTAEEGGSRSDRYYSDWQGDDYYSEYNDNGEAQDQGDDAEAQDQGDDAGAQEDDAAVEENDNAQGDDAVEEDQEQEGDDENGEGDDGRQRARRRRAAVGEIQSLSGKRDKFADGSGSASGNGRRMLGIAKLREYHDYLWVPAYDMVQFEWSDKRRAEKDAGCDDIADVVPRGMMTGVPGRLVEDLSSSPPPRRLDGNGSEAEVDEAWDGGGMVPSLRLLDLLPLARYRGTAASHAHPVCSAKGPC